MISSIEKDISIWSIDETQTNIIIPGQRYFKFLKHQDLPSDVV